MPNQQTRQRRRKRREEEIASVSTALQAPSLPTLPGEIRNRIYRLVLVKQSAIPLYVEQPKVPEDRPRLRPGYPALALVCRSTFDEVRSIYYSQNTFFFTPSAFSHAALAAFTRLQKHPLVNITSVKITRYLGCCSPQIHCNLHLSMKNGRIDVKLLSHTVLEESSGFELWFLRDGERPRVCVCVLLNKAAQYVRASIEPDLLGFLESIVPVNRPKDGRDRSMKGNMCRGCGGFACTWYLD